MPITKYQSAFSIFCVKCFVTEIGECSPVLDFWEHILSKEAPEPNVFLSLLL